MNAPNGETLWRWIATTVALFATSVFLMGAGWFYDTRDQPRQSDVADLRAELELIHERQNEVLTRLAVMDAQLMTLEQSLRNHVESESP